MTFDRSPSENPYAVPNPSSQSPKQFSESGPRRVPIHVIELLTRAWNFVSGQYWMLLLIVVVGIILGSLVPMNVLLGAILVGIYLCFMQVERGEKVEFPTLFRGFEHFVDSLIVIIGLTVLSLILVIPIIVVFIGVAFASLPADGDQEPGLGFFLSIFSLFPLFMVAGMLTYLPFLFSFQLIADRKLGAIDAIKLSCQAVWMNLGGILLLLVVLGFLSFFLVLMCYVPLFLFAPISLATLWVLYRDIFPEQILEATAS